MGSRRERVVRSESVSRFFSAKGGEWLCTGLKSSHSRKSRPVSMITAVARPYMSMHWSLAGRSSFGCQKPSRRRQAGWRGWKARRTRRRI